jgi:tellurite methyltransferase
MEREIVEFAQDEESDWFARLDCGHAQHQRHNPPLVERPWVLTREGRDAHIGGSLDCLRCDRREIPEDYVASRRTATFDAESTPAGLRSRHTTKSGVWARIHVLAGRLRYRVHDPYCCEEWLDEAAAGVVLPGVEHEVEPQADSRFFVEFWRRAGAG